VNSSHPSPPWTSLRLTLRPGPLIAVLANALVLALSLKTAPFGLFLAAFLVSWTAKHSIATLHALAVGAREVPVLSLEMIFGTVGGWRSFFAMLVLVGAFFGSGAASFWVGPWLAGVMGLLAAAVLPAALVMLGWTNSVTSAFDPRAIRRMAAAMGGDYWALLALCALATGGAVLLFGFAQTHLVTRLAALHLAWLLMVVTSGVTIHANRGALESMTEFYKGREIPRSAEDLARERQQRVDEIYAIWRSAPGNDAWRRIRQRVDAAPSPEDLFREIYERTALWEAPALAERVAGALIALDLLAGRSGSALRLARERLAVDPAFRLTDLAAMEELARLAVQAGDRDTAAALLASRSRSTGA
jgi:hypothetical protein